MEHQKIHFGDTFSFGIFDMSWRIHFVIDGLKVTLSEIISSFVFHTLCIIKILVRVSHFIFICMKTLKIGSHKFSLYMTRD